MIFDRKEAIEYFEGFETDKHLQYDRRDFYKRVAKVLVFLLKRVGNDG